MPLMPFLGTFTFAVLYRRDKYNIIHYYGDVAEKRFDGQMPAVAAMMLPTSCLIHCVMAIILTTDPWLVPNSVFESHTFLGIEMTHRALLPNTLPQLALALVFAVTIVLLNFGKLFSYVEPRPDHASLKHNPDHAILKHNPDHTSLKHNQNHTNPKH